MPGLPREELEVLASLARGEEALARLKERAMFAAGAARGRPFLVEALARVGVRGVPLFVHEPALSAEDTEPAPGASALVEPGAAPRALVLPVDLHVDEDRWTLRGMPSSVSWTLRVTFLGGEPDFLETAAAGFAGVWGPVGGRDVFALQYLVELARDLSITYVPSVESEADLATVLRTDVPYVGFGRGFGETPEAVLALHRACAPRLPAGLHASVLLPSGARAQHARIAFAAGAHAVVGPSACVAGDGDFTAGASAGAEPGDAKT